MVIFTIGTYGVNSLILGWCGSVCGRKFRHSQMSRYERSPAPQPGGYHTLIFNRHCELCTQSWELQITLYKLMLSSWYRDKGEEECVHRYRDDDYECKFRLDPLFVAQERRTPIRHCYGSQCGLQFGYFPTGMVSQVHAYQKEQQASCFQQRNHNLLCILSNAVGETIEKTLDISITSKAVGARRIHHMSEKSKRPTTSNAWNTLVPD